MSVRDAVVDRFIEICKQKNIKPNMLANLSGITPSTYMEYFTTEGTPPS